MNVTSRFVALCMVVNPVIGHMAGAEPADELAAFVGQSSGMDAGMALVLNDQDGKLTAAVAKGNRLTVQGCTWDTKSVQPGRAVLLAAGVGNRASIACIESDGLPYADNLVNLIVSASWGSRPLDIPEILRVLAPDGIVMIGNDANPAATAGLDAGLKLAGAKNVKALSRKGWIQFSKPVDPRFDTWTHNIGGPDLSTANDDRVAGPWDEVRWIGDPRWGSLYVTYKGRVTAGGRFYYKENRMAKDGILTWLVARDAWNGFELWRIPIGPPPKYGTLDNAMTCDETQVYDVEDNRALTARDGRSGRKIREYSPGFLPTMATLTDSILLTCDLRHSPPLSKQTAALDKESGKILWTRPGIVHPPAENGVAFVLTATDLEAVKIATGTSLWKTPVPAADGIPRVFCKAGVVYVQHEPGFKPPTQVVAFDAADGKLLWSKLSPGGGYATVATRDGLVLLNGGKSSNVTVLDPRTGETKRESKVSGTGKCFPVTGSANYLLYCNSTYLDIKSGTELTQNTVRSPCALGHVPANGLTYFLPHHCDCGISLRGVLAMAPAGSRKWLSDPAMNGMPSIVASGSAPATPPEEKPDDWPMYRKDTMRSNFTSRELPAKLELLWAGQAGNSRLCQAVSAYGIVYTTEPQNHSVLALDAATGNERWSFIADGRVEYPPSLHKGLCLFSTGAGSVYALDATTGNEVWRMRAAPAEKYIVEEGQFASAWPVVGGVMPMNGEIFFTSGRSGNVDGGILMYAANAATGKVRWQKRGAACSDFFVSDGKSLYLTKVPHQLSDGSRAGGKMPNGILRTTAYFTPVSVTDYMACVEPHLTTKKHIDLTDGRISGENLAFSDKMGVAAWRYRFGVPAAMMKKDKFDARFIYATVDGKNTWLMDDDIRQQMMGVILAGNTAYMAGIPTPPDPDRKPELWVLAGADGSKLQVLPLDARPVYDGLSAAGGRLYVACDDGRLLCFGAR